MRFGRFFGNEPKTTFTQDEVNAMMAEHKRGLQAQLAQMQTELEKFKGVDVTGLQTKITDLNSQLLSKDELAKQEAERIKKEAENNLKMIESEKNKWQATAQNLMVSEQLQAAALKHNAVSPEQIKMFFGPQAKVVPVQDDKGITTGYKVLMTVVKEGKAIDLAPDEAIGVLRENAQFGNLFKVTGKSGTGTTLLEQPPTGDDKAPPDDTEKYMAWRAKQQGK